MVNEWDSETKQKVRNLRLRGHVFTDIENTTGVPSSSAARICNSLSLAEQVDKKRRVDEAVSTGRSSKKRAQASLEEQLVAIQVGEHTVTVHGRAQSTDLTSIPEIFEKRTYCPQDPLVLHQCQSGRWQVLDIGANVGYASIYIRLGVLANVTVDKHVLVEPSQENVRILRKNVQNACIGGVKIIGSAVAAKNGFGKLHAANAYNKYRKSLMPTASSTSFENVSTLTATSVLGNIVDSHKGCVFLKIDCEGGEKYLFEAFPSWIRRQKNIQLLIVIAEVSFDSLNLSHGGYNDLKAQMRSVSLDWLLVREIWERAPHGTSKSGSERKGRYAASRVELMYFRKNVNE